MTRTCPTSQASVGGAGADNTSATGGTTASGGMGGAGEGGGGSAATCGNGMVEPGELCFTQPAVHYATQGEQAIDLVLVDCNADQALDIVVSNYLEPELAALVNSGTGTFDTIVKSGVTYPQLIDFDVADLGAGAYEISALSTLSGRILWITGDPVGPCAFQAVNAGASSAMVTASTYIDLNSNAVPDNVWVVGETMNWAKLWFHVDHNPDSFSFPMLQIGGYEAGALAAGDLIGGGAEDLLIALKDQDRIQLFENQNGMLVNYLDIDVPPGGVGDEPVDLSVGDLNGDAKMDVVSANQGSSSIAVIRNLGGGSFASQNPEPSVLGTNGIPASAPSAITLGDMDADGDLDAVTANANGGLSGSVTLFLNDGSGKLTLASAFPLLVGTKPAAVQVGDVNGDGALDIVTANEHVQGGTSSVSVVLANP